MIIHPSRLPEMADEVKRYCEAKGWYDEPVSFLQALALLHEEVSEAGHAWRDWGLEDATAGSATTSGGHFRSKPEGVGSEFADILIRWLDDEVRFTIGAISVLEKEGRGVFGINDDFLVNINTLHVLVARVSVTAEDCFNDADRDEVLARAMASVLAFLFQLAEHCKVDLFAEFERKMQFNWTRQYRHGGKRA